jgi:hypothetical protein
MFGRLRATLSFFFVSSYHLIALCLLRATAAALRARLILGPRHDGRQRHTFQGGHGMLPLLADVWVAYSWAQLSMPGQGILWALPWRSLLVTKHSFWHLPYDGKLTKRKTVVNL